MASLTVRQLDEKLKKLLRMRAARHGRSMEDEVRAILRQAAGQAGREALDPIDPPNPPAAQPARVPAASVHTMRVVLIIGGGIAAYKSLDLIRRLRERGLAVRCVLTTAAQHFVTPLAASALAGEPAFIDLFDPRSELDVGHIRLARACQPIRGGPASGLTGGARGPADRMAKRAGGHADDRAAAGLLATDKPVLLAPAMNPHMWSNAATQRNLARLAADGVALVGPNAGEMAERG